jgi:uncharacterized protein HemX
MDMAKQTDTDGTAKTTNNAKAPAAKKKGHGKLIAGIIVILLLLVAVFLFSMYYSATPAQEHSQFNNQLTTMQASNQSLGQFYLNNAPNYQFPVNQSWSVQVTDESPGNSTPIGQLTVSWDGQSKNLSVQQGIVNTGITPTYAVTLTPSEFLKFSQAAITKDIPAALAYYSEYYLTGEIEYTRVN